MPALDLVELEAWRVVALPAALDAAARDEEAMIRVAADEALFLCDDPPDRIGIADPSAIVVTDDGWSGSWMSLSAFHLLCAHAIDYPIPTTRPVVIQGLIAGVPAKVWIRDDDEDVLLFTQAAFAHELTARLG